MLNISGIILTFNQPSGIDGLPICYYRLDLITRRQAIHCKPYTSLPLNLPLPSRQDQTQLYVVTVSVDLLLAAGVT